MAELVIKKGPSIIEETDDTKWFLNVLNILKKRFEENAYCNNLTINASININNYEKIQYVIVNIYWYSEDEYRYNCEISFSNLEKIKNGGLIPSDSIFVDCTDVTLAEFYMFRGIVDIINKWRYDIQ